MNDGADVYISSPPASPKPKVKSKAAAKPKYIPAEGVIPTEKSKTAAMKTKAKTQTGARTRAAATKSKDGGDVKAAKKGPPQKGKAKAKRKLEVASADEEEGKEGGGERGRLELAKISPAVIEVLSSPPEPPKAILPKRKPISRVTPKEVFSIPFVSFTLLFVALIVHTRNALQTTNPRGKNRRGLAPRRRRWLCPIVRKLPQLKR